MFQGDRSILALARWGIAVCVAVAGLWAAPAHAQTPKQAVEDALGNAASSTMSFGVLGTTTTAALVFVTIKVAQGDAGSAPSSVPGKAEAARAAEAYLLAFHAQLRQDLARGAGPLVTDLAIAARLGEGQAAQLGRALRADREALLALSEREALTPERAYAFFERVAAACRADPVLASVFAG